MNPLREMMIVTALAVTLIVGVIIAGACTYKKTKYKIYAASSTYYCNHFTISGNTIYFTDVDGDSVFINGNYTLVYEKALSEE